MIARCDSCARSYLEIDSRKLSHPLYCVTCSLNRIERMEAERIAQAASALRSLAAIPAAWIGRKRAR